MSLARRWKAEIVTAQSELAAVVENRAIDNFFVIWLCESLSNQARSRNGEFA
jgi:hypothetical protein